MKTKIFLTIFFLMLTVGFVSAGDYKYDSLTVKFIDSLTLEPIANSQITTYYDKLDNGVISQEKVYTTNSNGEIEIPLEGKVHYFRSDKGDNVHYVNQLDSIISDTLKEPQHTIYMNPIFDIQVDLKTDFNFLFDFFRMFRYGAYVQMPSSELNTQGTIEPSCFMASFDKGATIKQYAKTFNIKAYFSRDLNSPNKKPNKCSIYAWESIRRDAGIREIEFNKLSRTEVNKFELPLDEDYDSVTKKLSYNNDCQTDFKMAYIYVYESVNNSQDNLERLNHAKKMFGEVYSKAGKFKTTIDVSSQIWSLEINDSNRDIFTSSDQYNPIPEIKVQEVMKEYYKTHSDDIDFVTIYSNFHAFFEPRMALHATIISNIEGIGRELWDSSEYYGSNGKLLGWIYGGDLNFIYSNESLVENDEDRINCMLAGSLLHETTHQWSAHIGNQYGNGSLELQNFGNGFGHWFAGLNVGYDPVGGQEWIDNKDGSFSTAQPTDYCATKDREAPMRFSIDKLSDLTLYLMGALDEYSVDPILWINYTGPIEPGITIRADSKYISIQDIIAEEGKRICK